MEATAIQQVHLWRLNSGNLSGKDPERPGSALMHVVATEDTVRKLREQALEDGSNGVITSKHVAPLLDGELTRTDFVDNSGKRFPALTEVDADGNKGRIVSMELGQDVGPHFEGWQEQNELVTQTVGTIERIPDQLVSPILLKKLRMER